MQAFIENLQYTLSIFLFCFLHRTNNPLMPQTHEISTTCHICLGYLTQPVIFCLKYLTKKPSRATLELQITLPFNQTNAAWILKLHNKYLHIVAHKTQFKNCSKKIIKLSKSNITASKPLKYSIDNSQTSVHKIVWYQI